MPKIEIDYSNTIIYKITCKSPDSKDVYVGHTTNFVQRKHGHKQSCINAKAANYECKLYKTIRDNGGWNNWLMEIVNFYNCANHYEARVKEQEYFLSLNATLNSIEPLPLNPSKFVTARIKMPSFICTTCNFKCTTSAVFDVHNQSKKHKCRVANATAIIENEMIPSAFQQVIQPLVCNKCDYICYKQSLMKQHYLSAKHIQLHTTVSNDDDNHISLTHSHKCLCGKEYKHRQGLFTHKKKCPMLHPVSSLETNDLLNTVPMMDMSIIMTIMQKNQEFQEMMVEQTKIIVAQNKQLIELASKTAHP